MELFLFTLLCTNGNIKQLLIIWCKNLEKGPLALENALLFEPKQGQIPFFADNRSETSPKC